MDIAAGKKETKQKTVMVEVPPPRWRVTAADLAAGAAAGASVELGAKHHKNQSLPESESAVPIIPLSPRFLLRSTNTPHSPPHCAAALYPIDTIKTQLQAMRKGGGMMSLLREGKGKGLYAGVWGT